MVFLRELWGFCDVQVTDSAIYAVFQGRTFKDIAEAAQKGDMTDGGGMCMCLAWRGSR